MDSRGLLSQKLSALRFHVDGALCALHAQDLKIPIRNHCRTSRWFLRTIKSWMHGTAPLVLGFDRQNILMP